MSVKKYFSISEVCEMCLLSPHRLRYIDKMDGKISTIRIRGRRYYTIEDISYLKQKYPYKNTVSYKKNDLKKIPSKSILSKSSNKKIIKRIDQLIGNFRSLSERLIQ